ncbi:competence protein ComE [Bacillus sp. UMB0899]|nr:competence protein ComE [Bacillus sp. UMB0899]
MNLKLNKKWIIIIISSVLTICCIYYILLREPPKSELVELGGLDAGGIDETIPIQEEEPVKTEEDRPLIMIDVKGAVQQPGVYEMPEDARVFEVIQKAGGLSENANELAVNLASSIQDGMVVYIPLKGETNENPFNSQSVVNNEGSARRKVNINSATSEELQTLTGIGPSKAEAIIAYREEQGSFTKIEDLLEVNGIGEKSFEKLSEEITVK